MSEVETFAPADDWWDEELYVVYHSDKTRGIGNHGVIITLEEYEGTGADDPRCRIAHGGDACPRTAHHNGPHIPVSMELMAMGIHVIARTAPQ